MPSLHAFAIAYVWFLLLVRLGQSVYLLLAVDDDGTDSRGEPDYHRHHVRGDLRTAAMNPVELLVLIACSRVNIRQR